jgi:hypothetical protein
MQPVDVLVRVEGAQGGVVVEVGRDRVLDQDGVHPLVGVESGDHVEQVVLGGVGGLLPMRGVETQFGGLSLFDADVTGAGVVVADQVGGEAGRDAAVAECGDSPGHVVEHGLGHGCTGQQSRGRGHRGVLPDGSPGGPRDASRRHRSGYRGGRRQTPPSGSYSVPADNARTQLSDRHRRVRVCAAGWQRRSRETGMPPADHLSPAASGPAFARLARPGPSPNPRHNHGTSDACVPQLRIDMVCESWA